MSRQTDLASQLAKAFTAWCRDNPEELKGARDMAILVAKVLGLRYPAVGYHRMVEVTRRAIVGEVNGSRRVDIRFNFIAAAILRLPASARRQN